MPARHRFLSLKEARILECSVCGRDIDQAAIKRTEKYPALAGMCSTCQRDFVSRRINNLRDTVRVEARSDLSVKRGKKLFRRMAGETTPSAAAKTLGTNIPTVRAWIIETGLFGATRNDDEDGYTFIQIKGVTEFLNRLENRDPEVTEVLPHYLLAQLTYNLDKIRERIASGALEK